MIKISALFASKRAGGSPKARRISPLLPVFLNLLVSNALLVEVSAPLVVRLQLFRPFDVALLALLGAAPEQDHQRRARRGRNTPGSQVPKSIRYSSTPSPTVCQ
jgi:hypothetical protein